MKIKTDEVKKIINEEFIKVAREVRRLTEEEVATLNTLAEQAPGGDVPRLQVELFNSLKELSGPELIQTADMLIADLETLKSQFQ